MDPGSVVWKQSDRDVRIRGEEAEWGPDVDGMSVWEAEALVRQASQHVEESYQLVLEERLRSAPDGQTRAAMERAHSGKSLRPAPDLQTMPSAAGKVAFGRSVAAPAPAKPKSAW